MRAGYAMEENLLFIPWRISIPMCYVYAEVLLSSPEAEKEEK